MFQKYTDLSAGPMKKERKRKLFPLPSTSLEVTRGVVYGYKQKQSKNEKAKTSTSASHTDIHFSAHLGLVQHGGQVSWF